VARGGSIVLTALFVACLVAIWLWGLKEQAKWVDPRTYDLMRAGQDPGRPVTDWFKKAARNPPTWLLLLLLLTSVLLLAGNLILLFDALTSHRGNGQTLAPSLSALGAACVITWVFRGLYLEFRKAS
jgi:hypothetical protein